MLNKDSKLAVVDFEYNVTPETFDVGPMHGFVIMGNSKEEVDRTTPQIHTFDISDHPNEVI